LGLSYLFTSSVFLTFPDLIDAIALHCRMDGVIRRANLVSKHAGIVTSFLASTRPTVHGFSALQILAALQLDTQCRLVGRKPNWILVCATLETAVKALFILI